MSEDYARRLQSAEWLHRRDTQALLSVLDGETGRTRAVGGIVRDTILDHPRERADIDLATELLPPEVAERAQRAGAAVHPTGIDHGTITVRLGATVAEVTTLRQDVETDGRRAVVRFGRDWTADAERRDFTLNALYAGMDGSLFDPLGGLEDCLAGRVRFIGHPDRRIAEDRLRAYRFFRFSASHGGQRFDEAGLAACAAWADRLDTVSAERIGAEMKRMLALPQIAVTLRAMHRAGLLDLRWGKDGTRRGDADLLLDGLERLESLVDRPRLGQRLAILAIWCLPLEALQARWRLSNEERRAAADILTAANLLVGGSRNAVAYRYAAVAGDAAVVAAVREDWAPARLRALQADLRRLRPPPFPLPAEDVAAAGYSGRQLGEELARLTGLWLASDFSMTREELRAAIAGRR